MAILFVAISLLCLASQFTLLNISVKLMVVVSFRHLDIGHKIIWDSSKNRLSFDTILQDIRQYVYYSVTSSPVLFTHIVSEAGILAVNG